MILFFYILGMIAGISTTAQTSINTKLSDKLGSTYLASIYSFGTATILLLIILPLIDNGIHLHLQDVAKEPIWIWFGGLCGTGIVALNILCLPKLGSALNVMLISFGQIISGMIIDSFGLFGSKQIPMSIYRTFGAVLLAIGVILVSKAPGNKKQKPSIIYMAISVSIGILCTLQVAINGRLTVVTGLSWRCTLISMIFGTLGCLVLAGIVFLFKEKAGIVKKNEHANEKGHWAMYTGGILAVIIVGGNALTAPVIGTGIVTIMNLIAQTGTGLLIDATGFLGIDKKPITKNKIFGILIMIIGTMTIVLI